MVFSKLIAFVRIFTIMAQSPMPQSACLAKVPTTENEPSVKAPVVKSSGDHNSLLLAQCSSTEQQQLEIKNEENSARPYAGKPKKTKPNSFVAVQIASPFIRDRLKKVQDAMVKYNKRLENVLTSMQKLHITLMVIRMETDEDIERGRRALYEASDLITAELRGDPLVLSFKGLGTFGSKVVFANISDGLNKLQTIAGIVREVFEKNGLKSTDKRSFNPHVTVAKISTKSRVVKGIPSESFSNHSEIDFGSEVITSLELLSMTEPEDMDGYYFTFERASFSK